MKWDIVDDTLWQKCKAAWRRSHLSLCHSPGLRRRGQRSSLDQKVCVEITECISSPSHRGAYFHNSQIAIPWLPLTLAPPSIIAKQTTRTIFSWETHCSHWTAANMGGPSTPSFPTSSHLRPISKTDTSKGIDSILFLPCQDISPSKAPLVKNYETSRSIVQFSPPSQPPGDASAHITCLPGRI